MFALSTTLWLAKPHWYVLLPTLLTHIQTRPVSNKTSYNSNCKISKFFLLRMLLVNKINDKSNFVYTLHHIVVSKTILACTAAY